MATQGQEVDMHATSLSQQRSPIGSSSNLNKSKSNEDVTVSSCKRRTRAPRSKVWRHFEKKEIEEGVWKAECNFCHQLLSGVSTHGTSHLHDHLKRCPILIESGMNVDSRKILTKEALKVAFSQEDSRKALVSMIIRHEYPLSIVDHAGFRNFVKIIQPLFKCPLRNTIKSDIIKIYAIEKRKLMDLFDKCDSRIAITTDMWTSNNQRRGYMVITTHYIDPSWDLRSRIIRFVYVPCPHTKEVLCEVLMTCLLDWNIDTKISTVTLDNCSTNDAMIKLVKDKILSYDEEMIRLVKSKIPSNSMILHGRFIHMRCCTHILNLIVKDGLNVIKSGIEKIRESVAYWTATPKRLEKFEETSRQLKISFSKKLCLDCETRWNSTFLMLQTALMYKDVFIRLKYREVHYTMLPSEDDWKFCHEVCEKLSIFYDVTELFSGSKYPTANLYFPNMCHIRQSLDAWIGSSNVVISNMAKNMLLKFEKYWNEVYVLMGVSAILDPRFKRQIIEYYFECIYGDKAFEHIDKVLAACYDLLIEYKAKTQEESDQENLISSPVVSSQEIDKSLLGFDAFLRKKRRVDSSFFKTDLDKYLEVDLLPRKNEFDILMWWQQNGDSYPTLKLIAKDLLAIPISTVASESAFSTGGRVIDPHRSRLQPSTIEALMCTQNWLRFGDGDIVASNSCGVFFDDVDSEDEDLSRSAMGTCD